MPVFDVSFLNPNAKRSGSGGGYNVLVDQLSILEKSLEFDGKLSPGDYNHLISEGRKLMAAPNLTSDQRSNIAVKIAGYQKNKSTDGIKDTENIDILNREVQDSMRQNVQLLADKPQVLLQANADALKAKIGRLTDAVNRADAAGDTDSATKSLMEYNSTVSDLHDTLQALSDSQNYKAGSGQPGSDYVAYVITNNKGDISDVQFGRVGKSGYVQTNGLYGGMQVYGKVNAKENGKNVFMMGGQRFSAPDSVLPGPDGTFTSKPLVAESSQKGGKGFKYTSGTPYVDFAPETLKAQNTIDPGGWAQGGNGSLYQRQQDGSYKKYVNVKDTQFETLGITPNNLLKIPNVLEQGIVSGVRETIDAAGGIAMPPAMSTGPTPTASPSVAPTPVLSPEAGGTARTPAPTDRSPQSTQGYAQRAIKAAGGFLGKIFGR